METLFSDPYENARKYLADIDANLARYMAECQRELEAAYRQYIAKPQSPKNSQLYKIHREVIWARYSLETAHIRAQREELIDVLTDMQIVQPVVILAENPPQHRTE